MTRASQTRAANLLCPTSDGTHRQSVGKLTWYSAADGTKPWIIHGHAHQNYRRIDTDSLGLRSPMLKLAAELGHRRIYLYLSEIDTTFVASLNDFQVYGTRGQPDAYGGTLNLPRSYWQVREGKLPGLKWVPRTAERVLDWCLDPWPMAPDLRVVPPPEQPVSAAVPGPMGGRRRRLLQAAEDPSAPKQLGFEF